MITVRNYLTCLVSRKPVLTGENISRQFFSPRHTKVLFVYTVIGVLGQLETVYETHLVFALIARVRRELDSNPFRRHVGLQPGSGRMKKASLLTCCTCTFVTKRPHSNSKEGDLAVPTLYVVYESDVKHMNLRKPLTW